MKKTTNKTMEGPELAKSRIPGQSAAKTAGLREPGPADHNPQGE